MGGWPGPSVDYELKALLKCGGTAFNECQRSDIAEGICPLGRQGTRCKEVGYWLRAIARAEAGPPPPGTAAARHALGLPSPRSEGFKLSNYPQLVEKVRGIVGLYLHPPETALVLCVGKKSRIQALDRTRPLLPLQPAVPSARPMTTIATDPPPCSHPWTSAPAK